MKQTGPLRDEQAWIPEPVAGDLLWPRRTLYGGDAKWTPYKGAHQPCVTCIEVLQDHERQPYLRPPGHPSAATKARQGPNGKTVHCAAHGVELEAKDAAIKAYLKDVRGRAEHMAHVKTARPRSRR